MSANDEFNLNSMDNGILNTWERQYKAHSEDIATFFAQSDLNHRNLWNNSTKEYYLNLIETMEIKSSWKPKIDGVAKRIIAMKPRYERLSAMSINAKNPNGVPWQFIAVIHHLEANNNFNLHLHNGDPLSGKTVHVPAHRIPGIDPPYTFTQSYMDAFALEGFFDEDDWSVSHIAWFLEKMNGFGYIRHGINSPYVFSGTNLYVKGKFVSDGVYDGNAVSAQIGAMTLLKRVFALDVVPVIISDAAKTDINTQSRKLNILDKIKAALMVVFGGYFTLDNLGMIPQFVSNFKAYGFNKEEIVIVLLLVLFFGVSAVIRFMSQNDFHDGTYTPKIMTENVQPISDNHLSVEVK